MSRVSGRPFVDCDSIEHRTIDTVSGSVVVAWNLLGLVFNELMLPRSIVGLID